MKTLFVPAKVSSKVNKEAILKVSKQLPEHIAIVFSIQFKDQAAEIRRILSEKHRITSFLQVLGCSKPRIPKTTQALLLIGSGKFHATSLALETELPIYILSRDKLDKISKSDITSLKAKQKASYVKFLNSKKIGILVSTKPGQNKLNKALDLRKNLKNKDSYIFIANNINTAEFENFPDVKSWVNTACPRMDMDSSTIINIDKLTL